MIKFVEFASIFLVVMSQNLFHGDVYSHLFARRCCPATVIVKSQILAILNSSLASPRMESGETGLYGFPYVIVSCLCSVSLLLLIKYSLRKVTTRRLGLSQYSNVSNLHLSIDCFIN